MKVAWLQDDCGYIGGAELTASEFKAAAPDDVEIAEMAPGEVQPDFPVYVVNNHYWYTDADLANLTGRTIRYHHDVRPMRVKPDLSIFCSPLQRHYMGLDGECVPPPVDLASFKPPRQSRKRREGTCSIAQWRNPGKGAHLIEEWAAENETVVHTYGPGPFEPQGPYINYLGPLAPEKVAQTLWKHEAFIFTPIDVEPFCRTVAEAHYSGCCVITNELIGARHYLEQDPEALATATDRFWELVLS